MRKLLKAAIFVSAIIPQIGLCDFYIKIGGGYKLIESKFYTMDNKTLETSKISARIELGAEKGAWSYGLAHHSQWFDGWPVNNKWEYQKTELFIDYKIGF